MALVLHIGHTQSVLSPPLPSPASRSSPMLAIILAERAGVNWPQENHGINVRELPTLRTDPAQSVETLDRASERDLCHSAIGNRAHSHYRAVRPATGSGTRLPV